MNHLNTPAIQITLAEALRVIAVAKDLTPATLGNDAVLVEKLSICSQILSRSLAFDTMAEEVARTEPKIDAIRADLATAIESLDEMRSQRDRAQADLIALGDRLLQLQAAVPAGPPGLQ